ncbi:MAG TPA: recombination mediator RecR [Melioribacteraceae bacterium]|nr:recombination mediator RecR [Melioribacteraceae bacterium]
MLIAEPLQIAIEEINKLPGIGRKTAQRLALHLLRTDKKNVDLLVNSILGLKEKLSYCSICFNITTNEICDICSSNKRDKSVICIVEDINDLIAIEKSNEFSGVYHVLGGVLSPLNGIGIEQLRIKELLGRLKDNVVTEIILALNPDTEGEATSLFLAKTLHPFKLKITRIARGLPMGSDLEFADGATIGRAVLNRIEI